MISAITIQLDHEEYSKYDDTVAVINASIVATGATSSDDLSWSIERLDGYGIVTGGVLPLTGPNITLSIDLRTIQDDDGINFANQGRYLLRVTDLITSIETTAEFLVAIITADELKRKWCYGVSLESSDLLSPVIPPRLVTGVTFLEFSRDHSTGPFDLSYVKGPPATLAWAGGLPQIVPTGINKMVLVGDCNSYVVIEVNSALLPNADVTETIVVDRRKMGDGDIRDFIREAVAWTESYLHVAVEPRLAMTPLLWQAQGKPYVDELMQPQSWYRPENYWQWLNFKVPVRRLLKVYNVEGYFQTAKSTVIPLGNWEVHDEYNGLIIFIPKTGAIINWEVIQTTFMNFLFGRAFMPDFWHYRVAHGLRNLKVDTNQTVREVIAKKAAIDVLLQAGSAQKAGIASESVSRDGVSQSISYTQSAMYGIYSHITIPYQQWLDDTMDRLKRRLGGVEFVTL